MRKHGIDVSASATAVSEPSTTEGNTLTPEAAAAAREALRAGVLGDYAREVDDLRAWHTDPADTAFGRARLRALLEGGAR